MAKKKQKKKENNSGFKYPIEIKGIVFIVVAIIGFLGFKANILGTIIKGFAMFLMGSFDFIVLLIMLISGFYMLVKRENPKYFSSRMIGIYIFLVGLLSLAHLNYLDVNSTFFDTMKNTIDEVIKCINTKVSFAGGGVIGAFFISIFYYLLGKMGSIIVISVLMLIGVILVSDLSISDAISKIREKLKRKKETSNEEDDEYENEEDGEDYDEETGEVIDKKAKRKEDILSGSPSLLFRLDLISTTEISFQQISQFSFHHLFAQHGQMVHEHFPVKMVELMLHDTGQISFHPFVMGLEILVQITHTNACGTTHRLVDARQTQTPFFH